MILTVYLLPVQVLQWVHFVSSTALKITPVTPPVQHAEGPHWDHQNNILYYTDTFKATAYRWDPKSNQVSSQKFDGRNSIGTITPIKHRKDEFIVSSDRYIYYLQWDGKHNDTGNIKELFRVDEDKPKNQFNDGKADVSGILWIGTLTRADDLSVPSKGGSLFRINLCSHLGGSQYEEKISNVSISNGLCWSKDNKYFFYIDSEKKTIEKYKFDVDEGRLGKKEIIFDLTKHPSIPGILDGMTIDDKDYLWVAGFGGSAILKIHPTTGKLVKIVQMPVKYVTSVVFGGEHLDVLYATTSRLHLSDAEVNKTPDAGSVFAITGLQARGLPLYNVEYNAE